MIHKNFILPLETLLKGESAKRFSRKERSLLRNIINLLKKNDQKNGPLAGQIGFVSEVLIKFSAELAAILLKN
jgi:hypothetical protein